MERCWELGGGSIGGVDAHKPVPAPFLTKTYQLVDDPSTDHIVSWGDDRVSTFVVWRPPEFARDLLPNYFKHNNFSSFVRQLNTYGFRKVVPERWEFANEFFKKGEKHLLCEIHRRKTSSSTLPMPSPPLFPLYHQPHFEEHHLAAAGPRWFDAPSPRLLALGGINSSNASTSSANIGVGVAGPTTPAALLDENERLRRSNVALLSELVHMKKLYNDIIYFVQNHVRPVAPSSTAAASANFLLSGGAAAAPSYHRRDGRNSGSTTSSSSLTIAEEPSPPNMDNKNSNGESSGDTTTVRPKLFGVTLDTAGCPRNKRGWQAVAEEPTSPSTKPRLTLDKEDLGLHVVSPPPSSC